MRHDRRFSFRYFARIQISNRLNGEPMGVLGDISLSGLRLVAEQPLAVGGCYEIRLHVPEPDGSVRNVDLTVLCRWSRKRPQGGGFNVGLQLEQESAEFEQLVGLLLVRR